MQAFIEIIADFLARGLGSE
jgi:hypothetical protein